jgi:hypothetical protein
MRSSSGVEYVGEPIGSSHPGATYHLLPGSTIPEILIITSFHPGGDPDSADFEVESRVIGAGMANMEKKGQISVKDIGFTWS